MQGSQDRSGQATRSASLACVTQACILIPLDADPQGSPLGLWGSLLTLVQCPDEGWSSWAQSGCRCSRTCACAHTHTHTKPPSVLCTRACASIHHQASDGAAAWGLAVSVGQLFWSFRASEPAAPREDLLHILSGG